MSTPQCPHCHVPMYLYEEVKKSDGVYGRYECKTIHCPVCKGKCTEKRLGDRPIRPA